MDDLDTPNCPECLERTHPRAAWWFCPSCRVYLDLDGTTRLEV